MESEQYPIGRFIDGEPPQIDMSKADTALYVVEEYATLFHHQAEFRKEHHTEIDRYQLVTWRIDERSETVNVLANSKIHPAPGMLIDSKVFEFDLLDRSIRSLKKVRLAGSSKRSDIKKQSSGFAERFDQRGLELLCAMFKKSSDVLLSEHPQNDEDAIGVLHDNYFKIVDYMYPQLTEAPKVQKNIYEAGVERAARRLLSEYTDPNSRNKGEISIAKQSHSGDVSIFAKVYGKHNGGHPELTNLKLMAVYDNGVETVNHVVDRRNRSVVPQDCELNTLEYDVSGVLETLGTGGHVIPPKVFNELWDEHHVSDSFDS